MAERYSTTAIQVSVKFHSYFAIVSMVRSETQLLSTYGEKLMIVLSSVESDAFVTRIGHALFLASRASRMDLSLTPPHHPGVVHETQG